MKRHGFNSITVTLFDSREDIVSPHAAIRVYVCGPTNVN